MQKIKVLKGTQAGKLGVVLYKCMFGGYMCRIYAAENIEVVLVESEFELVV